jgi:hypothetical protein
MEMAIMTRNTHSRKGLAVVLAAIPLTLTGCNNGVQGAFSGAALGSLAGLGIGSVTGDRSDAVTMGAILGGVGGAIIGDQNARASAYSTRGDYGGGERIVERPVYVDREVYVERPVYVQPSPVVIYRSGGHYSHHHHSHYSPRRYHHQRRYDPCW